MPEPQVQVAVALIVADDGRLLLQLRDDVEGVPARGMWGLFGGHIDPGESPQAALLRELGEELGWRPRRFEPWAVSDIDTEDWGRLRSYRFGARLDVPLEALTLGEGQALALFAPDAPPAPLTQGIAQVLAEFAASDVCARLRRHFERVFVAGLIVDREGRFLLQHRDDKAGIINPGKWSTFGGHLEPYETPEDGFMRELAEELAWQPAHRELFEAWACACDGREHLVYDFAAALDVDASALELHEGQGKGWFAPDALPDGIVPETRGEIERFIAGPRYGAVRALAR